MTCTEALPNLTYGGAMAVTNPFPNTPARWRTYFQHMRVALVAAQPLVLASLRWFTPSSRCSRDHNERPDPVPQRASRLAMRLDHDRESHSRRAVLRRTRHRGRLDGFDRASLPGTITG